MKLQLLMKNSLSFGSTWAEEEEEEEEVRKRVNPNSQLALLRTSFSSTADLGAAAAGMAKGVDAQHKQALLWSVAGAEGWLRARRSFSEEMYAKAHMVQNIISAG